MKGFYKCLNIFVDHRINGKAFDLFFYQKQMFSRQERNTETKREKL